MLHLPTSTLFPTRRSSDLCTGGVRRIRLPTSPDFGLPKGRTTIEAAECELPSHWNRNPIATPEYRSRDSRKAVSVSLSAARSEEHTSELQSRQYLVCRLML